VNIEVGFAAGGPASAVGSVATVKPAANTNPHEPGRDFILAAGALRVGGGDSVSVRLGSVAVGVVAVRRGTGRQQCLGARRI
jgi:hypothetical protein